MGSSAGRACLVAAAAALVAVAPSAQTGPRTIDVPGDAATIQDAIERARPGDVILLAPGTYPGEVEVPEDRPGITIRGADRNAVVFDGGGEREEAIDVLADGVALENMTAHHFDGNAFSWHGVEGFAGRYLTVWSVEYYGIYAIDSTDGVIEDSYVSWAADAGFYVGECRPCRTTLRRVTAVRSAIGYSGTNATGVVLRESAFIENGTGIMPNSYDEERHPPQAEMVVVDNVVRGSGTVPTPNEGPLGGFTGMGIAIAGGVGNDVRGNTVTDSAVYGIALYPTLQRDGPPWAPGANRIEANEVSGSGTADLAVSSGSGPGNCFQGNDFGTSLPAGIEEAGACPDGLADGDPSVGAILAVSPGEALERDAERPDWRDGPPPEPQPTMPGVSASPEEDRERSLWLPAALAVLGALAAVGLVVAVWRRNPLLAILLVVALAAGAVAAVVLWSPGDPSPVPDATPTTTAPTASPVDEATGEPEVTPVPDDLAGFELRVEGFGVARRLPGFDGEELVAGEGDVFLVVHAIFAGPATEPGVEREASSAAGLLLSGADRRWTADGGGDGSAFCFPCEVSFSSPDAELRMSFLFEIPEELAQEGRTFRFGYGDADRVFPFQL